MSSTLLCRRAISFDRFINPSIAWTTYSSFFGVSTDFASSKAFSNNKVDAASMVNPSVSGRVKSYQCNSVGVCRQLLDKTVKNKNKSIYGI